jgi:hypothetical protein
MTNKEQIQRDMAVAFDFVEQIVENPDIIDKIPEGSAVTFLDEENKKAEKKAKKNPAKKYVRVKRHFEVI